MRSLSSRATYDEVRVVIQQGDTTRTFNIEKPASGHPISVDTSLPQGFAADDVYAALRNALSTARP